MHLKAILKRNEKLKSKLRLLKITIRGKIIPQPKSLRWLKKVSSMSSYGPPRNYYGALKMNLKTCDKTTKLRVYKYVSLRYRSRV